MDRWYRQTIIPRLDIEYQLSRPIFFRLVGQYDAVYVDSLRDASRTELPIYIKDPNTGIISRAVRTTTNVFGGQALFAYQPVPGTVVFVGYGNNLTEPVSFRFLTLTRGRRTASSSSSVICSECEDRAQIGLPWQRGRVGVVT